MSMINHGQRGRMEDQRCSINPSKSAPCSPQHSDKASGAVSDDFLNILANSQSRRLDDQRVSLPSLPGLDTNKDNKSAGESGYLCYMVSKVQGSRMEDQRCSLPQIFPDKQKSGSGATRSSSFTPSDLDKCKRSEITSEESAFTKAEQNTFLNLMTNSHRGRMDDQRCVLNPTPQSSPKHQASQGTVTQDSEKFFNMLANSQGRRLDDQRMYLPSLPGIKNGSATSSSAQKNNARYYLDTKVQSSRMDNKRCSAPNIYQNACASAVPFKIPLSHTTENLSKTTSSPTHCKTGDRQQEISSEEEDQFRKMMSHAQRGRMEEQRCSFPSREASPPTQTLNGSALNNIPTGAEVDAFFKVLSVIQARRLDDQRVALPVLPGIRGIHDDRENGQGTHFSTCASTPYITVAECTPTTPRRGSSALNSHLRLSNAALDSPMGLPKSASFTPETDYQKDVNAAAQMTVRVSMSFTPQQEKKIMNHPVTYPEVFLTFGAPGDKLVIPLSPLPNRPLSLDLSLIPKKEVQSRHASPRKAHSKPPSPYITSSHPPASCSNEQEMILTSTITPEEDRFSFIQRVHTTPLQKMSGQKSKGDHGKGKGCAKKGKKNGNNKR
ncbi:uncharacterized protein LOC114468176 isoform X2 [Gouania willdenowi]|nr:uncharacterized protein LOC114468176 isoform X2 [Gouania willdenowi]